MVRPGWMLLVAAALVVGSQCGCNHASDSGKRGVVLLRYAVGSQSTEERERGFLETMAKEFPEINILSSDEYAGATADTALQKSQQLLIKYGKRADGIFAVNESSATGMLQALEERGLLGKLVFIGFDANPRLVEGLEAGSIQGLVLQDPVQIGYRSIKTLVAHLEKQEVEKKLTTGEHIATPKNMHEPEYDALLHPPQYKPDEVSSGEKKYKIVMIPKGTTHEFWKSVHAGAEKGAHELGNVELRWQGPLKEDDRDGQISVMEQAIARHVDGICLAPLDSQALAKSVEDAHAKGIPTVIFDSGIDASVPIVSYVATDNYHGGVLAAQRLAAALKQKSP